MIIPLGAAIMRDQVRRALRVIMACALILALMACAAQASTYSAKTNKKTKVYAEPKKSSASLTVKKNLKVKLTAASSGWGEITYKNHTAYIPIKYLTLTDPIKAYTTVKSTVYRKAGSGKRGTLSAGKTVYVIGLSGKYARVRNKSGSITGYVKAANLSRSKTAAENADDGASLSDVPSDLRSTTTSASVSKIEYTIYVAQNLLGTPYAEHANPPKTFDCATFTRWCYNKAQSGTMKDSSYTQGYDTRYEQVAYDDLKRGDLVCFNTIETDTDLCDHVGIYLGDGYFIHGSSAAKKVIISQMVSSSTDYYKRNFSWGRRIFDS